jgi:competence ComEA-like helix-hairpin-helix protein
MAKRFIILFLYALFLPLVFVMAAAQVDINTATLQQLDGLTGIGPVMAQRIIDARPFSSVDDLLAVKGIGPKTLQKIKDQGLACVSCAQETQEISNSQFPISNQNQNPSDQKIDTTTTPTATPTPVIIYPSGVFINEIMPNPKGPDGTDEWIELYNSNNFDVDLSGWKIQDTIGTITTYIISNGTKILSNGFLVFKRPDTQIMLNNDQDSLNLLTPDGKIIDSVNFTSAPLNQSYNKAEGLWAWSTTATPGLKNIITAVQNIKTLSKAKNSVKNSDINSALADISQNLNTNQDSANTSPWFLFFIVLTVTIILAVIVLLIKLKFSKKYVRT